MSFFDSWIDIFEWYQQCALEIKSISSSSEIACKLPNSSSAHTSNEIMCLIAEGFDVLECARANGKRWNEKEREKILSRGNHGYKRLNFGASIQCQQLLKSLLAFDLSGGNRTMFRCNMLSWQIIARDFLRKVRRKSKRRQDRPLLKDALSLLSHLSISECAADDLEDLVTKDTLIKNIYHFEVLPLQKYINDYNLLQEHSREAIEVCRGNMTEETVLCEVLEELKSLRSRFRLQHENGLQGDNALEREVDQRFKDISFILRTYEYESILVNKKKYDTSYRQSSGVPQDLNRRRISLGDLLSISDRASPRFKKFSHDKKLSSLDTELSRITHEVMMLHADADKWQEDASKCIPTLSKFVTGATTRLSSASQNDDRSDDSSPRLESIEELKRLSEHPVLQLVS